MDDIMDLFLPGCTFIPNTTIENDVYWNYRSPLTAGEDDAFYNQALIDFMLDVEYAVAGDFSGVPALQDCSTSTSTSAGSPPDDIPPPASAVAGESDRSLRVLHLLIAAAEALSEVSESHDLARVILARLSDLATAAGRTDVDRLAAHFTDALQGILDGGAGVCRAVEPNRPADVLEAIQLLQDMSPYVKFGHFTANQAILEAVAGERRVHIVDYDVMEGMQWASLMQAFASQADGFPPPRMRITAVTGGSGRRSVATVQETGRRLVAFAASVGVQFSFGQYRLEAGEKFQPAAVKVAKGEAVVLNCVLNPIHLPHRSVASVGSFLGSASALGAKVVTVVEEKGSRVGAGDFVGRFLWEMERYSAIMDSLVAGFPKQGRAREVVERKIFGPRIAGSVERAYRRDAVADGWSERMEAAGFVRLGLSSFNLCQARLLVGLFNDGYRVEEEGNNMLVLCWKSCRLFSASAWLAPAGQTPSPAARSDGF